jgi:hypothetical protein
MIDLASGASVLVAALCAFAAIAAIGALSARSLFVAAMASAAMAALSAAAVLGVGDPDTALALAAIGVGIAPVLMLGATLLSAPAAKPGRKAWPLVALAISIGAAVAVLFSLPELAATQGLQPPQAQPGMWLAGVVFVAALGVVGLLGFGERGVLEHQDHLL